MVISVCPKDGLWEETADGKERILPCQGDTVGQMTRRCRIISTNVSSWDDPDYQYCLPKYPPSGMGYLDFAYSIPHSKTLVISNNPQGIVKAVSSVYGVHPDHVSVYRIARHDVHVGIFLWFQ